MKFLAIIQARCGSTRLPNKVLLPLAGKPAILRMVERVKRSKKIDEVIVATSIEPENLPLIATCSKNDIRVFVGSENDVLDRFYQVARLMKPEYVVRLTADCPCIDITLLDEAISQINDTSDYISNMSGTLPDGLDFEIVKFEALKCAWKEAKLSSQREHVTQFIVNNKDRFHCQEYTSKLGDHGDERWTVDETEDYELVSRIYSHFVPNGEDATFSYSDILRFLDGNPELRQINSMYSKNEGLVKSLREDHFIDIEEVIDEE